MKRTSILAALALAALVSVPACQSKKAPPSPDDLTKPMNDYLAARGELCIGKSVWPIDVTTRELQGGSRNALQMPVFERLGFVTSADARATIDNGDDGKVEVDVKRYSLTPEGQKYMHPRTPKESDFCVARLSLDKITRVDFLGGGDAGAAATSAVVTYTYKVDPAPFTMNPEVRKVLPAVARVIDGAGTAELKEGFVRVDGAWVANELAGDRVAAAAPARP